LIGIRERALAVGGHVVVSGEANRGTRVVVTVPRQEAANRELGT
jgi:signal transduction histidine kinase